LNTLKQFYPQSGPNVGDPTAYTDNGVANWQENVDASRHSDQFDVRGDQYFGANQKFLVWGKFTWKNYPINAPEILNVPSQTDTNQNRVLKIDTNWSIKPNLINEGGFGFTRVTTGTSTASTATRGQRQQTGRDCRTCSTTAFRRWTSTTSRALMRTG
jgi:hypothetical protein